MRTCPGRENRGYAVVPDARIQRRNGADAVKKTSRKKQRKHATGTSRPSFPEPHTRGHGNTEDALYESERKYRSIFEHAPLGILHFDRNGTITACNDNFVKIIGSSKKDVVGLHMPGLPDNRVVDAVARTLHGAVASFEADYHSTTAHKVTPVNVVFSPVFSKTGAVEGGIGIVQDVTERRLYEETVALNEERFRTLTETTATAIFVYSNDRFVYVNKASQDLTGYSADELLSMRFWDVVHPQYKALIRERGMARQRGEDVPVRYEFKIVRKDGSERWIDFTSGKIPWQGTTAAIASAFDITERKEAEEAKRRLEERLLHAQKMEAIGRLAGGVAHDFNNMLNVIIGYAELVLGRLDQESRARKDIEEIIKAATRSASLTQKLLAFSRKQIIKPEVVSVNDLVKNLETMLRRLVTENIDMVFTLARDSGCIRVDPAQLEQVIINLVINARDAMPGGGKLIIETSAVELTDPPAAEHAEVLPGTYSMIAVTDTGHGMDHETRAKIFEPFFTTKERGKGTGLGLATVYGTVKQSGGTIFVFSGPGQGTSFKIYFPRTQGGPPAVEIRSVEKPRRGGNEHILVVEDEANLRHLFEATLPALGYRVMTAANGDEAMVLVEERGLKPHMVITDVVMPGMGGAALVDRLRQTLPDIKVLFMSGYTDNAIMHHGVLDPGTPFIQKPFHIKDLAAKVQRIMNGED